MESSGFKILVIDDSLLNQAVLRNILTSEAAAARGAEHAPYIIEVANAGPEGLEKARELKPDLILLDIIMPGMNGFEVLAKLKESSETWSIPVIIITGLEDALNEEKGLVLGAVDYITKPFKEAVVLARIKNHRLIVEQMRMIEHQSLFDPLTNIMNRRSFDFQIDGLWAYATRKQEYLSVVMIDIDHFKKFNDTYGHQQGDIVLQITAKSIASALKRTSDKVFRWGGEEFAVLLPTTDLKGALHVAELIRESIENTLIPYAGEPEPLRVTASLGVASKVPGPGDSIEDLVKQADESLYAAKEAGRNRVCGGG